jgi:hypothetical protein
MSDLVERLRATAGHIQLNIEAADEIERLRAHVEELHEKVAHKDCACSFDFEGDVCMVHSPAVQRLEAEVARLRELFRIDGEQHAAYVKEVRHEQDARLDVYKAEVERWKFNEEVQMQRAIKAEAEVARKTAALRRINNCEAAHEYDAKAMREIARAELEDK